MTLSMWNLTILDGHGRDLLMLFECGMDLCMLEGNVNSALNDGVARYCQGF